MCATTDLDVPGVVIQEDRPHYPSGEVMNEYPEIDSIYTEYHPSSGRPPEIKPLHKHNYRCFPKTTPMDNPWTPFQTRLDFKVLEFAMELGFNDKQLKTYINLLHQVVGAARSKKEKFTVQDSKEAKRLWDLVSSRRVAVSLIKPDISLLICHSTFNL